MSDNRSDNDEKRLSLKERLELQEHRFIDETEKLQDEYKRLDTELNKALGNPKIGKKEKDLLTLTYEKNKTRLDDRVYRLQELRKTCPSKIFETVSDNGIDEGSMSGGNFLIRQHIDELTENLKNKFTEDYVKENDIV